MGNASKGTYYRNKTKHWLENDGYVVVTMEVQRRIFVKGRVIFTKNDIFASDLLAMNSDEIMFVQVKLNRSHIAEAIREFNKYPFPKHVRRIIAVWEPRIREPFIIDVDESGGEQ